MLQTEFSPQKLIIEDKLDDFHTQHDGRALVIPVRTKGTMEINGEKVPESDHQNEERGLSFRFQSFDGRAATFGVAPKDQHKLFKLFQGRKVRITIETLD